jgi:putative flippase GtrA
VIGAFKSPQFFAFLLTGGFAAAVNFGSRIVYNHWVSFPMAVALAYLTGMLTAYVLARRFVFMDSKQTVGSSATRFALVNVVAIAQTWLISMALAYYLLPWWGVRAHVAEISHAVGVIVPVFTSYLGHKRWSFKA